MKTPSRTLTPAAALKLQTATNVLARLDININDIAILLLARDIVQRSDCDDECDEAWDDGDIHDSMLEYLGDAASDNLDKAWFHVVSSKDSK